MDSLPLKDFRRIIGGRFLIMTTLLVIVVLAGCKGVAPGNLGIHEGRLAPCPATPNCVSSQSTDKEHAVDPLRYTTSRQQAFEDLKAVILHMKRARIITEDGNYLHVEFTSALWRFVDDGEFYFDENAKTIQVRSASRMGKSDLGVNRKRVESIRAAWNAVEKR